MVRNSVTPAGTSVNTFNQLSLSRRSTLKMTPYAEHFRQVSSFKALYVPHETLGEEFPGKIVHAISLSSNSDVTVKVVSKALLVEDRVAEESFQHEMEILDMIH